MSRKYGKTKAYGGAGLQFDKLLKACSNSKKPSVTNTAGAIGRFGIASFTSTRNSGFDSSNSFEEQSRFKVFKRPRIDVDRNLAEIKNSPFYGENLLISNTNLQIPATPPASTVYKPKKFFKSRNLDADQSLATDESFQRPTTGTIRSMPITIPNPTLHLHHQHSKKHKGRNGRKDTKSNADADAKAFQHTSSLSPPTSRTEHRSNSSTSPSIKIRIFKDKRTSKFVSVADNLPPKLEAQVVDDENEVLPKKRGRKPKVGQEQEKIKLKPDKIDKIESPAAPQRRSGRLTRNSTKLRRSDSIGEMPTLTSAVGTSEDDEEMLDLDQSSPSRHDAVTNVAKIDSAEKLVRRLEAEDSEFRELTAMLSSMEGGGGSGGEAADNTSTVAKLSSVENSPSRSEHSEDEISFQPSPTPINYSTNSTNQIPSKPLPPKSSPGRDFRSILEDEWDESYDEESPRKSCNSPNKVSRFDMPEAEKSPMAYNRRSPAESMGFQYEYPDMQVQSTPQVPPLNSSYAVRNLLSEITKSDSVVSEPKRTEITPTPPAESPPRHDLLDEPIEPPHTPEKFNTLKKSSIFKSRMVPNPTTGQAPNPKKRLALYRHKFGQETEKEPLKIPKPNRSPDGFDDDFVDASEPLSLRRGKGTEAEGDGEGSKVYCSRETKKLFTVIRNVKAIHELQESGEVHEFDGDIWYILEDLKEKNPISSRCLSAITLAMRCMEPGFRMHLRAHGTVAEFARELHDAPNNPVLALAAATVLFVLSQDRLNMDLDTESFQLILALAKTEQTPQILDENPELSKHKQRIIDLVTEMKNRGHAKHIKIEKITASELALETLLFLTSKRAGEWVKQELRSLGGLDYIVTEVGKALNNLESYIQDYGWSGNTTEILWKIDRCLKVLQQVTFNHEENQKYLLGCEIPKQGFPCPQNSPDVFVSLFQFLTHHLSRKDKDYDTFITLREILFSVLRVLVNLTHDYRGIVLGSEILTCKTGFLELALHSIFTLSTAFADGKAFDLLMHSLCMLLNIVEHSKRNREVVLAMKIDIPSSIPGEIVQQPTLDALIHMFFRKESEAKKEEASTDDILTNSTDKKDPKTSQSTSESQNSSQESKDGESSSVQDIIDKLIETAGKHMENSMIAAHVSLLIAYLIMDSADWTSYVRNAMPNAKFLPLMVLLKKLFNFMAITTSTSGSTRGLKATSIALKYFEKCDPESALELKKIIPD